MGFDAGTAVEKMEYDFSAFDGSKGVIPEPSQKDVETYQREVSDAIKQLAGMPNVADDFTMEELSALTSTMDEVDMDKINSDVKEATAKLCSGTPSHEELDRLPHRVFQAFQKWLQGELSPESSSVGTKASLRVVRGA